MRRDRRAVASGLRRVLIAAAVLWPLICGTPVVAQQGGGSQQGGGQQAQPPGEAGRPFQNVQQRTRPGIELHPTYSVRYGRDRDVSSWDHNFDLSYPVSQRFSIKASSSILVKHNEILNRDIRQENWSTGLNLALTSAIGMGLKYNRVKQVDVRDENTPDEVRSFREKDTVEATAAYNKVLLTTLDTSLNVSTGFEKNEYADVKSRGATQNIGGRLSFHPIENLGADISYSGKHGLLDSEQGDLRSTDETIGHNLSSKITYEWGDHRFSMDMRRTSSMKQYPKQGQTETRTVRAEGTNADVTLAPMSGLRMRFSYGYTRDKSGYALETSKDSDTGGRTISGNLDYDLGSTSVGIQMKSDSKRNEYYNFQTGGQFLDSFGLNVNREFGEKLDVTFKGSTSLVSHQYDDIEANDQDRDMFDQEGSLRLSYTPVSGLATGLSMKVRESKLIYIRRTRTGDNKTTRTYAVEPSIQKTFGKKITVSQRYSLSADYTYYTYNRDSNFLIRNTNVSTTLEWKPTALLGLSIGHTYRSQDDGSYAPDEQGVERYGRSGEKEDQGLTMGVRYKFAGVVDIEATQSLNVQTKWKFDDGVKTLWWKKHDTSLTLRANLSHTLESGSTVKGSVSRTLRDATGITERQQAVWNISMSINRTF